jgi:hypothetical protein
LWRSGRGATLSVMRRETITWRVPPKARGSLRLGVGLLAVLASGLGVGACGSGAHRARRAECARTTAEAIRGATRPIARPLALDPSAVTVCVYNDPIRGDVDVASFAGSTTLTGSTARTLIRLIDTDPRPRSGCDGGSPVVLFIRYRRSMVRAKAAGCSPERLSGPRGVSLTGSVGLQGLYAEPLSGRGLRVPSVVGDSLPAAVTRLAAFYARHPADAGTSIGAHAGRLIPLVLQVTEHFAPGAKLGTVIFQTPLPKLANDSLDQIDVLVATPSEPRCRERQLVGLWSGDEFGTGDTFGGITFGDRSATACRLTGRLSLQGIGPDGRPDTPKLSWRLPAPFVLSPRARLAHVSLRTEATLTGSVGLAGDSRDGPGPAGLCAHETVPAVWRIRVDGVILRVRNGPNRHLDGRSYTTLMFSRSQDDEPFFSCGGNLIPTLGTPPQITNFG